MIFTEPLPFQGAIDSRKAKRLLPTDLSSEQLAELPPEVLEWASFAAGTMKADALSKFDEMTARIAGGATPEDFARRAAGGGPLLLDRAAARIEIKKYLGEIGYKPTPGTEGTIQDLSSSARINLKLRTDVEMAQGFGQFQAGQTPATLDLIPCQELVRIGRRRVPRNWPQRWREAGGRFYGKGRMIAAKDDPIWAKISRFKLPYPPFDYNSGMGVRGVRRAEAVALGVIPEDYQPAAQPRKLTDGLQAVADHYNGVLQDALTRAGYVIRDGILTTANYRPDQLRVAKGQPGGGRFAKETHFGTHENVGGTPKESGFLSKRRADAIAEHLTDSFKGWGFDSTKLDRWHKSMRVENPVRAADLVTHSVGFSDGERQRILGHIQHVLDVTPREIAEKIPRFTLVRGPKGSGGSWDNARAEMTISAGYLHSDYLKTHVFHETMHAIHLNGPDSYKATLARQFRVRTAGEDFVNVGGGKSPNGKKDDWLLHPKLGTAYAGRVYRPDEPGCGLELPSVYGMMMSNPKLARYALDNDKETLAKALSIFYYGRKVPGKGGTAQ